MPTLELGQRGGDGTRGFTNGDDEETGAVGDDRYEMTQERERVFVGVLQVVEHDDDGFGRDRLDGGLHGAEEPDARRWSSAAAGRRRRIAQRRKEHGEIRRE